MRLKFYEIIVITHHWKPNNPRPSHLKPLNTTKTDLDIWRCVNRDDTVKYTAILLTSKNMGNPNMKKPHSHQPDENAITIAKCRDAMKRRLYHLCSHNAISVCQLFPFLCVHETFKAELLPSTLCCNNFHSTIINDFFF
jgi:hypothetical protein